MYTSYIYLNIELEVPTSNIPNPAQNGSLIWSNFVEVSSWGKGYKQI